MSVPYQVESARIRWHGQEVIKGVRMDSKSVGRLRRAYKSGVEKEDLVNRFGISYVSVWQILRRKTWKNVP